VTFWIPGPLPGLNEMIAAAKSGRGAGNAYSRQKRVWTETCGLLAKASKVPPATRVQISFEWIESNQRRDPDNIAAARKFVLDGLVQAGLLPNDGWGEIAGFSDSFRVGAQPGVRVTVLKLA